jgi:DtxR family manganese transport transcriptional regulator
MAEHFIQTRAAHRSEVAQDYVETILDLIEENGEARVTEIAARFAVAHPTVSKTLRRLENEGLVVLERYRAVRLSDEGLKLAKECRERHKIVYNFLLALGLESSVAEVDAEGIEHHVSAKTLEAMRLFTLEKS